MIKSIVLYLEIFSTFLVCVEIGWFPAKFVEMLDERSKEYSRAGDDAISAIVTDLVRGTLCPALKAILQHGMRTTSLLGMFHSFCILFS